MNWRDRFPRTPRVAIVGRDPATRNMAPWDDPRWQVWIVAPAAAALNAPTWDAAFELHEYIWHAADQARYRAWLREQTKPVVVGSLRGECPGEVLLPRAEMADRFGPFFTSTIAWMLGMAIARGTTREIALYGVGMRDETEYAAQRPCVLWLAGWARGAGIELTLPQGCDLLTAPLYPPN